MEITDSIYGNVKIDDPVLSELIETPAMQRLKGVDQNAVAGILKVPWGKFSRFDHCLGVMLLLRRLGGKLEEQVAGLIHDISHTAFSHAMDFALGSAINQDFHEQHLERIVKQSNIPEILHRYGYGLGRILDHHNFTILEQPLPALCADRVDYALKTFLTSFNVPLELLKKFLTDLVVHEGKITFRDQELARQFADLFLKGDQERWGGSYLGNTVYHLFSNILKQAYERREITFDDFFTTDRELLEKLSAGTKVEIANLARLQIVEVDSQNAHDLHLKAKIRYVDPPVHRSGKIEKLSVLDDEFAAKLQQHLNKRQYGNYVKIISS